MIQEVTMEKSTNYGKSYWFQSYPYYQYGKMYADIRTFIEVHYERLKCIFKFNWRQISDVSAPFKSEVQHG